MNQCNPCRFRMLASRRIINLLFLITQVKAIVLFICLFELFFESNVYLFVYLRKKNNKKYTGLQMQQEMCVSNVIFILFQFTCAMFHISKPSWVNVSACSGEFIHGEVCLIFVWFQLACAIFHISKPLISWVNVSACFSEFNHGEVLCLKDLLHI